QAVTTEPDPVSGWAEVGQAGGDLVENLASLGKLSGKPISAVPECARRIRAILTLIVDAFLVWAAHEAVRHDDCLRPGELHERQHLRCNLRLIPYVSVDELPVAHLAWFRVLVGNDADHDLRGAVGIGTIKGDCRYWPTSHALLGLLAQALR